MSDFLSKFEKPVTPRKPQEDSAAAGDAAFGADTSGGAGFANAGASARAAQQPVLPDDDIYGNATKELPSLRPGSTYPNTGSTSSNVKEISLPRNNSSLYTKIAPVEHETSFDDGYKRRRVLRTVLIILAIILVGVAGFFFYTMSQQVTIPDFVGKPLTEAQAWARENNLSLVVTEEYSIKVDDGLVMSQQLEPDSTTTKGSTFALTVSNGPDPNERLTLPDFSTLTLEEARKWIEENRANNLRIVQENSDTIPKEAFIKIVFRNESTTAENYTRKDYATLYYSKGPEVLEKNIEVPDFRGKTEFEVQSWADTNSITLEIEEAVSATVPAGSVISQSIPAKTKIAKKETLRIVVSLGKALVVPNFAQYNAQTAAGAAPGLMVNVKTMFSLSVPFGKLISQSVGAGYGILPDQDITITVIYSEGQPYLRNYIGLNEGDMAELFWQDYTSKGANVSFSIEYVDSAELRGTIVGMSNYNSFIPMDYHVVLYVSNGNAPAPPPDPDPPDPEPEP